MTNLRTLQYVRISNHVYSTVHNGTQLALWQSVDILALALPAWQWAACQVGC
jgi:hypothetical protein